jgi:hypothetical protein
MWFYVNTIGDPMREVPKSTLPDEALDVEKCRQSVESALQHLEPKEAFDRNRWLADTKAQLTPHSSASR